MCCGRSNVERVAYETEFGTGWLVVDGERLVEIVLPGMTAPDVPAGHNARAVRWGQALEAYYSGRASLIPRPDLVAAAATTRWSADVYAEVSAIRPGTTMTYADVACATRRPGAARAVGAAMARNRFAPFIPCHRVVGADGSLRGYAGGLDLKRSLLEMERASG